MSCSSALRRLLVILALVGVVMAPFAPAMAAPIMAAKSMTAMSHDMPCCPDEPAVKMDCTTACPFVARCVAGLGGIVLPQTSAIKPASLVDLAFSPGESFALSSLAGEPPSRPPKI